MNNQEAIQSLKYLKRTEFIQENFNVDVLDMAISALGSQNTILQYITDGVINHELKTLPQYLSDVTTGKKKFELRIDDRDYQVGDIFCLREWDGEYTGKYFINSIGYVLRDCPQFGLKDGYCIFGW